MPIRGGDGARAEIDHLVDFDQGESTDTKAGVIDETIGFLHVTCEGFAKGGEGVLVNPKEEFGIGGCGEDLVEERIERGVGHGIQTERGFAHFADTFAPGCGVFGAVVSVQTKRHLELIDRFGGETFDEDLVQSLPRPMMVF